MVKNSEFYEDVFEQEKNKIMDMSKNNIHAFANNIVRTLDDTTNQESKIKNVERELTSFFEIILSASAALTTNVLAKSKESED